MILAAQAVTLSERDGLVIATTNVRHLALFAPARVWREVGTLPVERAPKR
jgi:hypothetical protein